MKRRWSLLWAARYVARWEGFLAEAYLDTIASPAVLTVGYGWTGPIRKGGKTRPIRTGDKISRLYALRLLGKGLSAASRDIVRLVKVPLTVRQRMALMSLYYNIGGGAFAESTLLKLLNRGKYRQAADEFLRWNHAGGVEVYGLTRRRRAERKMFLSKMSRHRRTQNA